MENTPHPPKFVGRKRTTMSARATENRHRWKPTELKSLRRKFVLTQENLARILEVAQQRIDEWESGRKNMSLAYSKILDGIAPSLEALLAQADGKPEKFRRLVLQAYGVEITDRHVKKAGK